MSHLFQVALASLFPALVLTAAVRDATSYLIPNWISLALVAGFAAAALASGLPPATVGLCVATGAAALLAGMAMFALRWIGGGDAKLFAATALWIGWPAVLNDLIVTGFAGGVLAAGLLALRSPWCRPFVAAGPAWMARLAEPGESVPYGVAIGAGALAAFPASPLAAGLNLPL